MSQTAAVPERPAPKTRSGLSASDIVYCGMFAALMVVGAKIHIMIPVGVFSVTISLQVFFAVLAGFFLGPWKGFLSVVIYLILGLIGLPIYAHGGGPAYLMKPTYGFLIGFAFAAMVTGLVMNRLKKHTVPRMIIAAIAGEMVYYACSLVYYYLMFNFILPDSSIGFVELMSVWFLSTVIPDGIICVLAALSAHALLPYFMNNRQS